MFVVIIKEAVDYGHKGCWFNVSRTSEFSRKVGHLDFNVKAFRFLNVDNWLKCSSNTTESKIAVFYL